MWCKFMTNFVAEGVGDKHVMDIAWTALRNEWVIESGARQVM